MQPSLRLGASLYVPATRTDLVRIGNGGRLAGVRSLIFCTEDAVAACDLDAALENLAEAFLNWEPGPTLRFVRVRNPAVMARLLELRGVDRIDGFVLPKTTRQNFAAYADLAADRDRFWLMPTLETAEAFDAEEMTRFRKQLDASPRRERILALRIGGNDLLNLLALRRSPGATIYDTPLGSVIDRLIGVFRPADYALTAPVFDRLDSPETLAREVDRDIEHGLIGKSAVHPTQVRTIEALYSVTTEEFEFARAVLEPAAPPVFRLQGCMCEPSTHRRWAQTIVERARLFGFREAGTRPGDTLGDVACAEA